MHSVVKWRYLSCCFWVGLVLVICGPSISRASGPPAEERRPSAREAVSGYVRNAKRDLAQSFLKTALRNRDSLLVSAGFQWKLGTIHGTAASSLRAFNQSFILAGRTLHRLRQRDGFNFTSESVAQFENYLGEVSFIESVEWDGLLLVLTAYKQGLLQLLTVDVDNTVILRQSITAYGEPKDAEFFVQNDELYLVVVASNETAPTVPLVVYRWYGTHLDEENNQLLTAPVAVSTFPFKGSIMIVVALQAVGVQRAGLAVLRRSRTELVKVQYLAEGSPSALQHFVFRKEHYLLVNNKDGKSYIAWWSGTEVTIWSALDNVGAYHSVAVGYVRDEPLLLLSEKNFVRIYLPTAASLQLLDTLNMNDTVQSAALYVQDQSVLLLALTRAPVGGFVPHLVELRIKFERAIDHPTPETAGPLHTCLSQLKQALLARSQVLSTMRNESANLLRTDVPGKFKGRLILDKLNVTETVSIGVVNINSTPLVSARELKGLIAQTYDQAQSMQAEFANVVSKSNPGTISGKLVAKELEIQHANMDNVVITKLNDRTFSPSNLLMHSKTQTFSGVVTVDKIIVDSLSVRTLNGHKVKDLLRRRGNQEVFGLSQVSYLSTNYIQMTEVKTINEISLDQLVTIKTPESTRVTGKKSFPAVNLQNLEVELMNNTNFTSWIESLRPKTPVQVDLTIEVFAPQPQNVTVKSDLSLVNLTVKDINGIAFDDLVASLFLKGVNQIITGDISYLGITPTVRDLTATFANGISSVTFLTKTTDQVILGNLTLNSLGVSDLISNNINGLKVSRDAAYVNCPFPISSPVSFRKLYTQRLGLPANSTIQGKLIDSRLLHQPLIKYNGKVKVKGNVTFTDFSLERSKFILNGQSLTLRDLPLLYWTKSSEQEIKVPVVASSGLVVKSLYVGKVNDVPPESLINLRTTNVLQGHWTFDSAVISGNLTHDPRATQIPISIPELASSVVRTSGNYTIFGRKSFLGGLSTNELLTEYLDSKKVSDLVTQGQGRGGFYRKVRINGDLTVHSDVNVINSLNGMNLCDRMSKAVLKDQVGSVPSASITAVNVSRIKVNTINGSPVSVWLVPASGGTTTRRVKKISLKGDLRVPALKNVLTVNNKDVTPEYIATVVDRSAPGVIRGRKTFVGGVVVNGDVQASHYSGVDLQEVELLSLSKTKPQGFIHPISMTEMSTVALSADFVNNIPMRNLLSSDHFGGQSIQGDIIFTNDVDVRGLLDAADFENCCDLNQVYGKLQILDGRRWASLTVNGDLTWKRSLPDRKAGLGYYLKNAVTKHGTQIISGDVLFDGTTHTNNIYSRMDINDVDIAGMMRDSLRRSASDQVIYGEKLFQKQLSSTSMRVEGNVVAKEVAGVNIQNLNRSLIRVMGDHDIRGHKHFLHGFRADMLKVDGLFNGYPTTAIATYDMAHLPAIVFASSLEIEGDLTFEKVNDFSLYDFLSERVTLNSDQQIHGHITFDQDLDIQGDLITPSINGIDVEDIVYVESADEQVVSGTKHFQESIQVHGALELGRLHGIEFSLAHKAALFRDEDALITGNFIFHSEVALEQALSLDDTVNGMKMEDLSARLRMPVLRNMARSLSLTKIINDTKILLRARGDLSELLYLEPMLALPLSVVQTRRAVATDLGDGEVRVDAYGWETGNCGLPENCVCPIQYTFQIRNNSLGQAALIRSNATTRSFRLRSNTGLMVRVLTNTVSSSTSCRHYGEQYLDETTVIAWMKPDGSNQYKEVLIYPSPILGYLTDVKLIEVGGRTYLALGLAYNGELDSSEMNSIIVRLDTTIDRAEIVREFPTKGVVALDVFYANEGAYLVVGNTFASKQAFVDIYLFDTLSEKLRLIRRVPSEGVVGIASVVHRDESLIIIAQDQPFAPLLVLKYDATVKDYLFIQQLIPNSVPTGLNVFYIGQPGLSDAFLGVSTADHIFHLYKYCHIEGFKPEMKMELRGVQGFTTFYVHGKQYLFFSSSEKSSVFEIVKQS